ncbi:MAG TPA: type II secretion system protein GspM [Anaeromyxobacter sp.]|nr:type II secretion system protein GspM [Anaeromyxobacter sp.]
MERIRKLRADVEAWLGTLSPRERVMVTTAAIAVAVFVLWLFAHQVGSGVTAREARIEQKTKVLSQIGKLADGYRRRAAERQALEARLRGAPVQLMSHISQTGATLGIQVNDLRPTGAPVESEGLREESVEVNLARIEMQKLGLLMQSLERGAGVVKVRRLRLSTRGDDPALLDATLVVSTFQPKS